MSNVNFSLKVDIGLMLQPVCLVSVSEFLVKQPDFPAIGPSSQVTVITIIKSDHGDLT